MQTPSPANDVPPTAAREERGASPLPDDAVRGQPRTPLEAADEPLGDRAERAVQGRRSRAPLAEQKLKHRDVESRHAALEQARAEERTAEAAERGARPPAHDAVRFEPLRPLEVADRTLRQRPGDAVDRALVVAVTVKGDLNTGHLHFRERRGLAGDGAGDHEHEDQERKPPHGPADTPSEPDVLPLWRRVTVTRGNGASCSRRGWYTRNLP